MVTLTCEQTLSLIAEAPAGTAASGDTAAALAAHLSACGGCRAQADTARRVRTLLGGIELPAALPERLTAVTGEHVSRQLRALAFETPLGWAGLAYYDGGIVLIERCQGGARDAYAALQRRLGDLVIQEKRRDDIGHSAVRKLVTYHKGRRVRFDEPLDLSLVPPFTQRVLRATARIPYGEVRPYAWVAREIGRPRATRAVGQSLHINPLAPVIPCHRVIASDNTLGGYGGGPEMKKWLLRLEGYLQRGRSID